MNINASVIMAGLGSAAAVTWICLYVRGTVRYGKICSSPAAAKLKFHEVTAAGFELMRLLGISVKSAWFSEKRKNAAEIYGGQYAEFYTYLFTGAQLSYGMLVLTAGLLGGAAAGSVSLVLLGTAAAALVLFILDAELKRKVEEKHDEIMCELPDIIIRLTLLINAGMVLREAWNMTAGSADTALGAEMKQTASDIRNGMPEAEAFEAFAMRCRTKEIRKFSGALVQNLKKGSAGLSECLQTLADEQWEDRKNYVRKKAASAEQKLLFPMLAIFVAVIIMIIVPVFTNMM